MALIEFKDGRPVEGSLEGVEVVETRKVSRKLRKGLLKGRLKSGKLLFQRL